MKITPVNHIQQNTFTSKKSGKSTQTPPAPPVSYDMFVAENKKPENLFDKFRHIFVKQNTPEKQALDYLNRVVAYRNMLLPDEKLPLIDELPVCKKQQFNRPEEFDNYVNNLKELIYVPSRDYQFDKDDFQWIFFVIRPEIIDTIVKNNLHKKIQGRNNQFSVDEICKLAQLTENNYPLMMKHGLFKDIKGREYPLTCNELVTLSSAISRYKDQISSKTFNNIEKRQLLLSKFNSDNYLPMDYIIPLAQLDNKGWKNIKNNGSLQYYSYFLPEAIPQLALRSAEDISRIISLKDLLVDEWHSREDFSKLFKITSKQMETSEKFLAAGYEFATVQQLLYYSNYAPDITNKIGKARQFVKDKSDIIYRDYYDVPEDSIKEFFSEYKFKIMEFLDILGEKPFNYLCSEGYDNMCDCFKGITTPLDSAFYTLEQRRRLKEKLNDKSFSPEDKILKYRLVMAMPTVALKDKLIDTIKTNAPTKEQMTTAKSIWVDTEKTFDEKMSDFNKEFQTADNKRVQDFFEKRAQIINGHKNLIMVDTKELARLIMNEVNKKKNDSAMNNAIYDVLFNEYLQISPTGNLKEKFAVKDSPYLSKLFLTNKDTTKSIFNMLKYIDSLPDKSVKEAFDLLPQNKITKELFTKYGLDYERWTTPDKKLVMDINTVLDRQRAETQLLQNIEEDLTNEEFKKLPEHETHRLLSALEKKGIYLHDEEVFDIDDDGETIIKIPETRLYKAGNRIKFEDVKTILDTIIPIMEKTPFWHKKLKDDTLRSARDNFYFHITRMRPDEIDAVNKMYTNQITMLTVRQADMNNITHSLFLGNHAGCCTALGSSGYNSYAAPRYVMDKFISAIEILDGEKPIGNTMCYFIDINGKPALVLDNIELLGKYQNIDTIRDAMIVFASKLCEVVGRPDAEIYAGPLRHKVSMHKFNATPTSFTILGSSNDEKTYIDFVGETVVSPELRYNTNLYKLK